MTGLTSHRASRMIYRVCFKPMSLLQAYLQKPSTQRVLSRKPGDKGFSLIELVVVVAVLAILAAIAVPAFMGMQEQAANAAAQTNLKNAYKECAYKTARAETSLTYSKLTDDAYFAYTPVGGTACKQDDGSGTLLTAKTKTAHSGGANLTISIDLMTGEKAGSDDIPGINWK